MRAILEEESRWLTDLGRRFRDWRLKRNDSQAQAAERLAVSVSTVRRMEAGTPTIPITVWLRAVELYGGGLGRLEPLLAERESRFARLEREQKEGRRQRASSRRRDGSPDESDR